MSKHTPEPWGDSQLRLCFVEFEKLGITVSIPQYADEEAKANSRRILSCVNACAGMADPAAEIAELKRQLDELLAALTHSRGMLGNAAMRMKWFDISNAQEILSGVDIIDKSISKAKGGEA